MASGVFSTCSVCTTFSDIGLGSDSVCARPSSHRIKSFDSLGSQSSHSRTSKLLQSQYRSLVSEMFYYLIQRHLGHEGSAEVLGRMLGPMQTDCGAPWAPGIAGWLLPCVVTCAFHCIPSDTEPSAFGHLFIWVYLEGCSCSSGEANAHCAHECEDK